MAFQEPHVHAAVAEARPATGAFEAVVVPDGRVGMGWLPDYADWRDYTPEHARVAPALRQTNLLGEPERESLPPGVDLRRWCSPVENQGPLGSCTANAAAGLVEYFERRAFGRHLDVSRLFLYKATRNLLRWRGDTGAFMRTTMGALTLFGAPPEAYYPYQPASFDEEPPAFCYAFAQSFQALKYVRLDPSALSAEELLARVKSYLAAGYPAAFGFTVYASIDQAAADGRIPFPAAGDRVVGGHAVMAAGYDDRARVPSPDGGVETTGALLVRNSWGPAWGDGGYGWLPYEYVLRGLAIDWWTLLKSEWLETGEFGL